MRGGMRSLVSRICKKFIEDGGLFITMASVSQMPIDYGITTGVSITGAAASGARLGLQLNVRGSQESDRVWL